MNKKQIDLARYALGLPNRFNISYRNCFVVGPGQPDYDNWKDMVAKGAAILRDGKKLPFGGADVFYLTRRGAEAVLIAPEMLEMDDFPATEAAAAA